MLGDVRPHLESPPAHCRHTLASLKLDVVCVSDTSLQLCRVSVPPYSRRVLAVRVLEVSPPPAHGVTAQPQDLLVTIGEDETSAIIAGHNAFSPGAVALLDIRELHNGEESSTTYFGDTISSVPSREQCGLGRERFVVQFAPSVEWHRLCTLGETAAEVNWVQPPFAHLPPEALAASCPLMASMLRESSVFPVRNSRDCDEVEIIVMRHANEPTNRGEVKVRVLTQGTECFTRRFRRSDTAAILSPLSPMDVYSVSIRGVYHAVSDACGRRSDPRPTREIFGVPSWGRWFVTLAPEVITIEAPTESLVRLHKQRHVLQEIALEDFGRRVRKVRRWEPYSFDIPPSTTQMLSIKASWADNEHLRAQRQEEIDGIDELLDLTRAYHVIERWRKMIRRVKRERRQFRRRLSQEKLDFEASYASIASRDDGGGAAAVGTAQSFDDAAFAKRKTEVGFLVAFQKSRREKLRASMSGPYLLEQEAMLPDRWAQFDIPDLPPQAMFRVVVSELDGPPSLSSGVIMSGSKGPNSMTLQSMKWRTLVTLPVLTRSDAGNGGVQQHSASFLRELLRLQVSRFVLVEHITERSITISWSPVDFDRIAQLVFDIQASAHSNTSRAPSPLPTPNSSALAHPTDQNALKMQELQALRGDISRAQQLEDKRIQFEYALLLTPVDDKTTLRTQHDDVVGSVDVRIPGSAVEEGTSDPDSPASGGVGSVISVFLSGCAYAPGNLVSPFAKNCGQVDANVPPPREERLRTYQHHHHINNLIPNQKYLIQLAQYNVLETRWYEPCVPILTCTAAPSIITVSEFPSTGELNASATCVVAEGLLSQLEATAKKTSYGHNILPRHAFSYSNCSSLEVRLFRVRSGGEPSSPTIVTTRSCALRDASKGVSFRGLEPNAMYRVTCRRITAATSRFAPQPSAAPSPSAAAAAEKQRRNSRSSSKLSDAIQARTDVLSVTVFTVRCMPVFLADIEASGLNVKVKKRWHPEMDAVRSFASNRSSFALAQSPAGSGDSASSPTQSLRSVNSYVLPPALSQQCSAPFGAATEDDSSDDPDADPSAEYAVLTQGFGVVLLSNTSDTNVLNFDPLGLTDDTLRVETEGYDRIVVMACVGRCYGTNEDAALEDFELMWPRMSVSLSLVVDWSLLPFAVKDDSIELLLTPVQCTPDLNWTSWDDESEDRVAEYQEVGKHLKRLIEAREENNAQFQGLFAEIQCVEGNFPAEGVDEASPIAPKQRRRSSGAVTRSTSDKTSALAPRSTRIACSGRPVVVNDLKPDTVYTCRVRPVMGGGAAGKVTYGAWSPEVKLRTAAALALDVDGIDDSSVSIKWHRSSPHPHLSISQLCVSYSVPQPTHHPTFVASVPEFVCFLYRHIIFGPFVVWRREIGPEGVDYDAPQVPEEPQPTATHHHLKELPQGILYFVRVQQRLASGMVGDAASPVVRQEESAVDDTHTDVELRVQSPASSMSEVSSDPTQEAGDGLGSDDDEDVKTTHSTQEGSWSSTTACVRTVGELKAHISPLGSDRFHVIVSRPGFEDDKYNGTQDELGRPVVVHRPKVQPLVFVQARVLSGYHPARTRGLLDATDDSDLLPSYPTVVVDGKAYWSSVAAAPSELYWTDRSGLTDHRMPFYDDRGDIMFSHMREVKQVVGARGTLLPSYHVVNLIPNASMSYVFAGLPPGRCHQVQVRSRCYPSAERVPSSGVDLRATSGTVLSSWSQPVLIVTFRAPRLKVRFATETSVTLDWSPPERPDYCPPGTEGLSLVEIETIAFTSGVDESYAPGTVSVNDAEDAPHRPRTRKFSRPCTTLSRSSTPSQMTDAPEEEEARTVVVDRLLPGGIAVAVATGYFGNLRGPTCAMCVFHTVCPVVVRLTGLSSNYSAVEAYRRTPLWQECYGGLEHFVKTFPHRVEHFTEELWDSVESQLAVKALRDASMASEAAADSETFDIELRGVNKDMECLPAGHAAVVPVAQDGGRRGEFFVTQLQPSTLYRIRARAQQATSSPEQNATSLAWSRAMYFATLDKLQLTLMASFETQSVFSVTRRPPADAAIPTWARRDVEKALRVARTAEWVELGLDDVRPPSGGGQKAVASSVVRHEISKELTLRLTRLQSGCTYNILCRALPTANGALQGDNPHLASSSCFSWRELGTVVTCPFAPCMPSLYESRSGSTIAFSWGYDASEAHHVGALLKQLPCGQLLVPEDVPEEIRALMHKGRVASVHCAPPSDRRASHPVASLAASSLECPEDYPLTPYSATSISFSLEAVIMAEGDPTERRTDRRVLRTIPIGAVSEAFARLEFAIPHVALPRLLHLRIKAVASVTEADREVESEWTPAFSFEPPKVPMGPPTHVRLVESLGNRAVIAWDPPAESTGHFQRRFQVSLHRPGGGGWRDAVWVRGSTTQCVLHGLMAKEPHKVRVIAHSTFAPIDGVPSAALCFTPFTRGRGLTADTGAEESAATLQSCISSLVLAQSTYPCPIADDVDQLTANVWPTVPFPSLHHIESRMAATRQGLCPRRSETIRIGEDVISELLPHQPPSRPFVPTLPTSAPKNARSVGHKKIRPASASEDAAAPQPRRPSSAAPVQARRHPALPTIDPKSLFPWQ